MSMVFWIRFVTTVAVCAGLLAPPISPARAQSMCVASRADCERDADQKLAFCTGHCTRYDNACIDLCDDTHDTAVRYCWITRTVCAEIERPNQAFPVLARRAAAPR